MKDDHVPASEKHGRLRSTAHKRRQIDTWTFVSPFTKHIDESPLEVKVFLLNGFKGSTDSGMSFEAFFPGKRLAFLDTDIERLRQRVEEQFRQQDLVRHNVAWEDWIELEISGFLHEHGDPAAALDLGYTIIKRGIDPKTRKAITINNNGVVVPFPLAKKAGEEDDVGRKGHDPDDWRTWGMGARDEGSQYSYIPATPENLAAVESVLQRLRDLRVALNKVLEQETIQTALSKLWTELPSLPHLLTGKKI